MKEVLLGLALALLVCASASAAGPQSAPRVEMKTSLGTIVVELNPAKAPKTVENFLRYVKSGFYNGTIFHRVMPGFMIQGGGFEPGMKEKPTRDPIPNEGKNGLRNMAGTIAMARRGDPDSATAQFFINHVDNPMLDYPNPDGAGYAVFGQVVRGMDIVQKIAQVRTGNAGMFENVPLTHVVIESVKLLPDSK
ncbi:peptidylprolyl isomerase [Georgfuchsia toluolica]|uniref:peptidylprolyl isomerase n=1 Tax=Georgfuchsia toluolica TaxID=424218 RepID=UPI002484BC0C|nr:peptidylprolyl isomerase [Georgfuchsia toluolica]